MILSITISFIISSIICRKERSLLDVSICTFLILSGLGTNFNLDNRMGNLMPADIFLFISLFMLFLTGHLRSGVVERKLGIFYIFGCLALFIGILSFYRLSDIIRDIKNYLYYLVPIVYLVYYREDFNKILNMMKCVAVAGVYTVYQMLYAFFVTRGISYMSESGEILKSFGLGIGADLVFCIAIVLFFYPKIVSRYVSNLGWVLIEILLMFTAFSSFVRSSWLVMGATIGVCLVLWLVKVVVERRNWKVKSSRLQMIVLFVVVVMIIVPIVKNNVSVSVFDFIEEKIKSIRILNYDQGDTLAYRLNDIKANRDILASPMVFIGYGFGKTIIDQTGMFAGTSAENSFLFYVVKFGICGCLVLFSTVIYEISKKIRQPWGLNTAIAVFLAISLVVQAMSGNLNKYYVSPFYVILMVIDIQEFYTRYLEEREDLRNTL